MLVLYLVPIFFIAQSKTYIPDSEFVAFSHAEADTKSFSETTNKTEDMTKTTEKEEVASETTTVETTTEQTTSTTTARPVYRDRETRRNSKKEKKRKEKEREKFEIVTEDDEVLFFPNEYVHESYRDAPAMPVEEDGYLTNDDKANNDENEDNLYGRPVDDLWDTGRTDENVQMRTDPPPNADTIFIRRKNKEVVAKEKKAAAIAKKKPRVNCRALSCNTTHAPVCGVRKEEGKPKYRLFMNECHMNKVNCGFKNNDNKYVIIPTSNCSNVGSHRSEIPYFPYSPVRPHKPMDKPEPTVLETRRSFASRRSNTLGNDGTFCDHLCPVTCPELYEPECAVSSTGIKMMFMNHCKLDFHSCMNNAVWYRRPMVECAGADKTDQRNNRAFIGWMQRIGVIDGNGKFVKA